MGSRCLFDTCIGDAMPPTKKTYEVNPDCLVTMTKITEGMKVVVANQKEISELIYGNGRVGLKEQTAENTRDIIDITKLLSEVNETKKLEEERKAEEDKDRKKTSKTWWLAIAMAIIVAAISIFQDVTTQIALTKLLSK
jgi:hypothetical protein